MTDPTDRTLTGPVADLALAFTHLRRRAGRLHPRLGPADTTRDIREHPAPEMGQIVTVDGIRMRIDPLMSDFNIRKLASGRHTVHERSLLSRHLRDEDRVLELGGGIGMVAIHCARRLGPGRVLSYEGNPRMEPLIRENYALNGVEPDLRMAVLGEREGSVTFYVAERFSHSAMTDNSGQGTAITVPMEPYEDARRDFKPTVLVVDIQGAEIEFFRYASLEGVRMVLVEFHPPVTGILPILGVRRSLRRQGFIESARSGSSSVFVRSG